MFKKNVARLAFIFCACSSISHATDVCFEGYLDGTGDCLIFDKTAPPHDTALSHFGSPGWGAWSTVSNTIMTISFERGSSNTEYCYDGYPYSTTTSGSATRCALYTMKNHNDDDLFSNSYTWSGTYGSDLSKAWAKPVTLSASNTIIFGVNRSFDSSLSTEQRYHILDAIIASGVKAIRLGTESSTATWPDDPEDYISNRNILIEAVNYLTYKDSEMEILLTLHIPGSKEPVKVGGSYVDNSGSGGDNWTSGTLGADYVAMCGWSQRTPAISRVDVSHLQEDFESFLNQLPDGANLIGVEVGNELDTACYNGDLPVDDASGGRSGTLYTNFISKYTDVINQVEGSLNTAGFTATNVVTFGATKAYAYAEWKTLSKAGLWNPVTMLTDLVNEGANFDVIGHHIYPDQKKVEIDFTKRLYLEIDALKSTDKDVWITEWGAEKVDYWPDPVNVPFIRYRSLVEQAQHFYNDPEASTIKKIFIYDFDKTYGTSADYSIFKPIDDAEPVPVMPEARVLKLYGNDLTSTTCNAGGWTDPCDSDSDGIGDTNETSTDPLNTDTDDDGILDGSDAYPAISLVSMDMDRDGRPDECDSACLSLGMSADSDDDGDSISDSSDNCPLIANTNQNDRDSDTIGNMCDPYDVTVDIVTTAARDGSVDDIGNDIYKDLTAVYVGDGTWGGKHYVGIFSFSLPSELVSVSDVTFEVTRTGKNGSPENMSTTIPVDLAIGKFGSSVLLEVLDATAPSIIVGAGTLPEPTANNTLYQAVLNQGALDAINAGLMANQREVQLRMDLGATNNDANADFYTFASTEHADSSKRPRLIINGIKP